MTGKPPAAPGSEAVRTVFLGSGRFAEPILARLAANPAVRIVAVVSAPPRPVGRRKTATPTPVHASAAAIGLPVLVPARLRDAEAVAAILAFEPDLLVLADYGQIVPRALLDLAHGALNLHPSLLPRHRGATPIPAAILAGDRESGVTLMRMDAGLDTGPIVAVEQVPLVADESASALEARLAGVAAGLLDRSLAPWLAGDLPARAQPAEGASLSRPLARADGRLDPARRATELERMVRAYEPWPGTYLEVDGDRLAVLRSFVSQAEPGDRPGQLVPDREGLALTTSEGRLVLADVRPAGGRPMPGAAFVRGRPSILGRTVHA